MTEDDQKNNKLQYLIGGVLILLAIGGLLYFFGFRLPGGSNPNAMPAPAVSVLEIAPRDIPVTFEYAGRSAGFREIEIRPRVSGILKKRHYVEGQFIKQNALLFEIDPAPFQALLAQAKAVFLQSESNWTRVSELMKVKAVSPLEYETAKSSYEQAKAELDTAEINLGYTQIVAPIPGVTSQEGLSEGSLVAADTSILTKIAQLDPIYINFAAPDADILMQRKEIAAGKMALPEDRKLRAEIHLNDGTTYAHEGLIDFMDSVIDLQTGTVHARAIVNNEDAKILPGQFVRLIVKGFVKKDAIAVPDQAILQGPQGQFVYVVDGDNKAQIKPVKIGLLNGTNRLIEEGLSAGDHVVIGGMIKARPGAPVQVKEPEAPKDTKDAKGEASKGPPSTPEKK